MSAPMSDPLAREHAELRSKALKARRDPVAATLGVVIMRAVDEAEQMRKQGADPVQVAAALEAVFREHWPKGRDEPWRDLCGDCRDYGWRIYQCDGDATCGREKRHAAHDYAVACWCEKGRAFLAKPKRDVDELTSLGKMPKAPSRWGR